jgi:hypothetical protein
MTSSTTSSQSRAHLTCRKVIENCIVCWLDESIEDESRNLVDPISYLDQIGISIEIFSDPDEFVDFATNIKDEKLFIILSDLVVECIVPLLQNMSQIVSIYILCHCKTQHKEHTAKQRKVKGIYTDLTLLCEHLKRDTKQTENNLTSISIISSSLLKTSEKVELNQLEPSFMYSQLFKEMVLEVPLYQADIRLHDEFVKFCRDKYADNAVTLKIIDEFRQDYYIHTPVWWYTRFEKTMDFF